MRLLVLAAMMPLMACQSNATAQGKAGQGGPSGERSERRFDVSDFTGVDLRGSDDVDIENGRAFAVTASGDRALLDQLDIRVENGVLLVSRKPGMRWSGSEGARVHVTMPRVERLSVQGSSNLSVDRIDGDVSASVAGSGGLKIGAASVGNLQVSIQGSGDATVAGTASQLSASIAGSGSFDAPQLTASRATVSVTGSGDLKARVTGPAQVSVAGSGTVELTGGAQCTIRQSGSASADCS